MRGRVGDLRERGRQAEGVEAQGKFGVAFIFVVMSASCARGSRSHCLHYVLGEKTCPLPDRPGYERGQEFPARASGEKWM